MKKYIIGLVVICAFCFAYSIHEEVMCRHEGYSENKLYENGIENKAAWKKLFSGYPFFNRKWSEIDKNIKFIDFFYYLSCTEKISEQTSIFVIKFNTSQDFNFKIEPFDVEKLKNQYYDSIALNTVFKWNLDGTPVLINGKGVVYKQGNLKHNDKVDFFAWGIMIDRSNSIWKTPNSIDDGAVSTYSLDGYWLIKRLKIDWLASEPLDEAHFIGIWQRGWLFKSKMDGQYIWILFA